MRENFKPVISDSFKINKNVEFFFWRNLYCAENLSSKKLMADSKSHSPNAECEYSLDLFQEFIELVVSCSPFNPCLFLRH